MKQDSTTNPLSFREVSAPGAPGTGQTVPLCVPEIGGNEWTYIKECLDTNWVSSVGSYVDRFERDLAAYVGTSHAVATINGTAALHVALLVSGVQPEDEVLVPSLSFIAPVNTIRYVGAWPVFIDSDPDYWQMDPQKVADFLDQECRWRSGALYNKTSGRRVKAVLPVHLLGHPCDMDAILDAAGKYDLAVVEDATESLGAGYKGRSVGHLGHIACFSFNGNKLITTGGGGMIVTDDAIWAQQAHYLTTQAKDDTLEYIHNTIGFNYRLSNIQAAMGVAQMERIDEFITKKRTIAKDYQEAFRDLRGITTMPVQANTNPVFWLYTILLSGGMTLDYRKGVIAKLAKRGIGARPLWHPIHDLPPYRDCQSFKIEHSGQLYQRGISLPSSVGLSWEDQQKTIDAVKEVVPS